MTLVLKKSVSASSKITVYDLHFALAPMETDIPIFLDNFQKKKKKKKKKFKYFCCDFMIRMYVLKVLNGHI